MSQVKTYEQLLADNKQLRWQLEEATDIIQAIRTGQIDALVVQGADGHELYTLKTADHTYRVFIETMNEGAVTLNEQGLILYCNSAFADIVDLPISKVIGLSFGQFIDPVYAAAYANLVDQGWAEARKVELVVFSNTHKRVPCLLSVTTIAMDGGVCLSMILTDLTAQKETQQLLETNNGQLKKANEALAISNQALNQSNSNLQQFAYIASHDLQEPLRKIQSFSDLVITRYSAGLGEGLSYLERVRLSASRMSTLIKDLLTFSRITVQQENTVPVPLSEVMALVLNDLEMVLQESGAVVDIDPLPTIQGDPTQLSQLFQNLLSNALKFRKMDHSGAPITPRVRVSSELVTAAMMPATVQPVIQTDQYYRIDIIDNGIGFDDKYVDRIFQVFQRLHGKNEFSGTGIGLAICEKVVLNHGGAITAVSQPGRGATFSIYLPT